MAITGRGEASLTVDWTRCDGHGICAEILPEVITLDDWGYPVIAGPIRSDLRRLAERARASCPSLALRLD